MRIGITGTAAVLTAMLLAVAAPTVRAQWPPRVFLPEQANVAVRDPAELAPIPLPSANPPPTLDNPYDEAEPLQLSLDEAIRIALANSQAIRVLSGVTAVASGRTIYDAAISATVIDEQQARFDPNFQATNRWNRNETPTAVPNVIDPTRTEIGGLRNDNYNFGLGLNKTTTAGGALGLGVNSGTDRFRPGTFPLNPQTRSSLDLSYTHPLLQGRGRPANLAPVVLARIDTERSFFQLKDGVQELVRSVIGAYWSLVFARTDVWVRQRQLEQTKFAAEMTQAKFDLEIADAGELSQTRVSHANFRSTLLAAENTVLEREAALRSILGLPPYDGKRLVPVTPLNTDRYDVDWDKLLGLAGQQRPDVVELKLVLEADEQQLLLAHNEARPQLNAVAMYRWNGLEGEIPAGGRVRSQPGQFTDWTLGIDFSVPLSLRRERAQLRRQELIIARDQANLQQLMETIVFSLGQQLRTLSRLYKQYEIAEETREAARVNLNLQMENYREGRVNFINALLAINDWGNTISSEAQFLTQYNVALADMERETGTILESHGVRFFEERMGNAGPLGRLGPDRCYPVSTPPGENTERYSHGETPTEQSFNLVNPVDRLRESELPEAITLPPPQANGPDVTQPPRAP